MFKRGLLLFGLLAALFAGGMAAFRPYTPAMAAPGTQGVTSQPTIVTFTAEGEAFTVDEVESGTATTMLVWQVVNLTDAYRLALEVRQLKSWIPLSPEDQSLPAQGSQMATLVHTLDFQPPTFRLVIYDAQEEIIDVWQLMIPYTILVGDEGEIVTPTVTGFFVDAESVDINALADGSARLPVRWMVTNRLPASNITFVQILDDGQILPVELPRDYLWIRSAGEGMVAPVAPDNGATLRMQVQVVDMIHGKVYDTAEIEIPIVGTLEAQPTPRAEDTRPALPTLAPTPDTSSQSASDAIIAFAVTPIENLKSGDTVVFTWETTNAESVTIQWANSDGELLLFENLPARGSLEAVLSGSYLTGSVQFILSAFQSGTMIDQAATPPLAVACSSTFYFVEPGAVYLYAGGPENGLPFTLCPTTGIGSTTAAYQPFENGFMIWREDIDTIYMFGYDGAFLVIADAYIEGETLDFGDRTPPQGLFLPERGFGKAWLNSPDMAQRLGFALAPAELYTLSHQSSFTNGQYVVLSLPNGGRLVVASGNSNNNNFWAYINRS